MCLLDIVARVFPLLTSNIILGIYFLLKHYPNIDRSQNILSFEHILGTVTVDASMVPWSICISVFSAHPWLHKLHGKLESD